MAVPMADLIAQQSLGLTVLVGADLMDRPVSWATVSELGDPTPWLNGHEFLLTTGMRIRPQTSPRTMLLYAERLVSARVTALGFCVGVVHPETPSALVDACCDAGLPLIEVPEPVPFIAISKSLSHLIEAQRAQRNAVLLDRMHRLSEDALHGEAALVRRIAEYTRGWCALVDDRLETTTCHPADACHEVEAFHDLAQRILSRGALASASVTEVETRAVLLPIGPARQLSGLLVAGGPATSQDDHHSVLTFAASLISLGRARNREMTELRRRMAESAFLRMLNADGADDELPWPPGTPVRLAALSLDMPQLRERATTVPGLACLMIPSGDGRALAMWRDDAHAQMMAVLSGVPGVVSRPTMVPGTSDERTAFRETVLAVRRHSPAVRTGIRELGSPTAIASVLDLMPLEGRQAWAATMLGPIAARADGAVLIEALQASASYPSAAEAAHSLGVHRHTLRARMRRAEEVLGVDKYDARQRAELLLACIILQETNTSDTGSPVNGS